MNISYQSDVSHLTFETTPQLLKSLNRWLSIQKSNHLSIDFTNVGFIDSAGIALLIELRRCAYIKQHKNLSFKFSGRIKQLIRFYDLEGFLETIE